MGCTTSQVTLVHEIRKKPPAVEQTRRPSKYPSHEKEQLPDIVDTKEKTSEKDNNTKENCTKPDSSLEELTEDQLPDDQLPQDDDDISLPDVESTIANDESRKQHLSPTPRRFSPSVPHSRPGDELSVQSLPDDIDELPRPPKRTKKELVPDPSIFKQVDEHALKAPPHAKSSVKSLREYLTKPFKTDLEKIRAFYRWIAHNIRYDTDAYFKGASKSCDPGTVLRNGTSVCQGYSELFKALCSDAGIECLLVTGFAKGFAYKPEKPFKLSDKTNHAWNLVCLESDWHPVECTWGSGHVNDKHQYVKSFREGYFLTDPHSFISNHYPWKGNSNEDPRLQLLENPVTLAEYNDKLSITSESIEHGVEYISHPMQCISFDNRIEVTLKVQPNTLTNIVAHVNDSSGTKLDGCTMILEDSGGLYRIHVSAPQASFKGTMSIFGTNPSSSNANSLATYVLHCRVTDPACTPKFPNQWGKWGLSQNLDDIGFTDEIKSQTLLSTENGEVNATFRTARDVNILFKVEDAGGKEVEHATLMTTGEDSVVLRARCPSAGYYKLRVFNSNGSSYDSVGSLLIHSPTAFSPYAPFPEVFSACQKHKVTLLQPLDGHLLPEKKYHFRIHSPLAKKLMVLKTVAQDPVNDVFDLKVITPSSGEAVTVFGSVQTTGSLNGYFKFKVI